MFLTWASQMHTTEEDKAWWNSMNHYVRNEDEEMPPAGRYNMGQKLLFWGFVFCGVLLLLTGLILWVPEYLPWNARELRYLAVLIHPAGALLTIGLFMIHIYMSVFMVPSSMTAITTGYVTRAWARTHHRLWYLRVTGQKNVQP